MTGKCDKLMFDMGGVCLLFLKSKFTLLGVNLTDQVKHLKMTAQDPV